MKGDFSRETFSGVKHYNRVLQQQGRVQVDADWNEQRGIDRHHAETVGVDVIGPSGAPTTSPGFEITATAGDLRIGAGRYYLDGVLCENEAAVDLTAQPDLRPPAGTVLPTADGLYLAYLEAWDRHITALEDPAIRESALGGPDTATRVKTVWQVRLLAVTDPGTAVGCSSDFPEWDHLLQRNLVGAVTVGRLAARSQPEEPTPDPLCILPPGAGYRGLQNQLYRVEVHQGGTRAEARFKWSRDNGTVASAIVPDQGGVVVSGSVIEVAEMGKDGMLTFASDPLPEWLELTDDRYELDGQRGSLARVQAVDPAVRTITFAPGTLPVLEAGEHPVVRRWDQRGAGASERGVAMTGDWQTLEGGVEIRFHEGPFRTGDFWLIPARTAIGSDTGSVEWPADAGGPIARGPLGTPHRFARLALVRRSSGTFEPVSGGDCRQMFSPLTEVQKALDAIGDGCACTIVIGPGEDLAKALAHGLSHRQDALVCLGVGTYELAGPVRVADRRHIEVNGAGPGTRIVAATSESALVFANCASVTVRDLHVETGLVGKAGEESHVNGALTFLDCPQVTVDDVSVRCAGGPPKRASCITVRNAALAPEVMWGARARIRDCRLAVGHLQSGVLVIGTFRVDVTDNFIEQGARPLDDDLLKDPDYRALLRPNLLRQVTAGGAGGGPTETNASVRYEGHVVHFASGVAGSEWQRAIDTLRPGGITSPRLLRRYLLGFASNLVRTRGSGPGGSQAFSTLIAALLSYDSPSIGQAVAVVGSPSGDVRITGNSMRGAIAGVRVGGAAAGVVLIADNTIVASLPSTATRDRFGVAVGAADSVVVERNWLSLMRPGIRAGRTGGTAEGIRIFGVMGRRVIVRHNHMGSNYGTGLGTQFTTGITFAPLNTPLPGQPLWIITENVMEASTTKVDVPAEAPRRPGVDDPVAVRNLVRGLGDNVA